MPDYNLMYFKGTGKASQGVQQTMHKWFAADYISCYIISKFVPVHALPNHMQLV